ncbi:MAG: tRNA pseudouridine(38-40) synthase TruA [Acidimicrobiia bacterium]|nr:tRNA pseudouridine(38-40) synthase TruA [Acidimicrobiia bacterium]
MRLKLAIEYAGTRYRGWQIQKNARTVAGEMTRAVVEATGIRDFELYGAGRTDAGVHALAQVAHLDLATTLPPETVRRRVNDALPSDIVILSIERVPRRFHARHDAVARSYVYQIARRRTAFAKPFVWWVRDELDPGAMRRTAAAFVGFHDFRAFSDADPEDASTEVHLETMDLHEDGDLLVVHVEGSHFLWKMVRRLVGVLVEVGRGRLGEAEAAALLDGASDLPARLTAPASGLFLERVFYPGDPRDRPLQAAVAVPRADPDSVTSRTSRPESHSKSQPPNPERSR